MLFEKSDIPHKFRRRPVPATLWWSVLGCLTVAMGVPSTTLLGTIVSDLGMLGMMVCMAILVQRFPSHPLHPGAALLMWVLVLLTALVLGFSVHLFWQADQLRDHRF
jgi:hypothetical protein